MRRHFIAAAALSGALGGVFAAFPARAEDGWTVVKLSGAAYERTSDAPSTRLALGMVVPTRASVGTAAGGRLQLRRGGTTVYVPPDTILQVIDPSPATTRVLLPKGKLEFEVEKRPAPYFEVQTRRLSAVVKGTHFTVDAATASSDVKVARGLVEVDELATGKTVDLTAGQSAKSGAGGFSVEGAGKTVAMTVQAPRETDVPDLKPDDTKRKPKPAVTAPTPQSADDPATTAATGAAAPAAATYGAVGGKGAGNGSGNSNAGNGNGNSGNGGGNGNSGNGNGDGGGGKGNGGEK
ncbi:MAG: FecR domain-containing protein [Hyphomicrobiales bacterium]|nr:FecR domain-containing protein [Hyphomicrobiales bacterium]